ncbi:hypothetical protein ACIBHX_11705 [Nonomuraea sp. NPDC050536]|uniref:hypothetical protein n=1 Tax=Nonomuraea sp. NPDC050536 TaxID=3364366 RepID=UPI0037C86841
MPIPRILFALPLLAAGLFMPALGAEPAKPPSGVLGMEHEEFSSKVVTVRQGGRLTMANSSRWVHIIGAGRDGHVVDAKGVPMTGLKLMETDDVASTGTWTTPGTFYLTCSVHPEMTVKVIVTPCGCCSAGSCA